MSRGRWQQRRLFRGQRTCCKPGRATCSLQFSAFRGIECCYLPLNYCRRAFYDKRVSQEVDGEALGEVRSCCCFLICFRFLALCACFRVWQFVPTWLLPAAAAAWLRVLHVAQ